MGRLDTLPNELFIKITDELASVDLKVCRLVSSLMRGKIDILYSPCMRVIFNEQSEQDFIAKKAPPLRPPFTRMVIGTVSYFANHFKGKRMRPLRKEYFKNISELEIREFIPKSYFDQIIKLTGENLRVLKLSSAVLGGIENIFSNELASSTVKPDGNIPLLFLRRALPKPVIQNMIMQRAQRIRNRKGSNQPAKNWENLEELHIKLDYVSPSTPHFAPLRLVENLRAVKRFPVPKLSVFNLTVEKSKEAEMFYFTVNSLLNSIPAIAYPSLKSVSVVSPKCRPLSEKESLELYQKNKENFSKMQLSELTLRIMEGHSHAIPEALLAILEAQYDRKSLKSVSIEGIRNAHILNLFKN